MSGQAQSNGASIPWPGVVECDGMAWATPAFPRERVNRAGRTYIDGSASPEDREDALLVINNWRSSHNYPLNTWQINLRRIVSTRDNDPTVAQRIKRLPSIEHKLRRIPGMKLSRMQDIGGCRAVLSSVELVYDIHHYYTEESRIKHRPGREDMYIDNPKASGYRGIHLVYSYFSDRNPHWNGLAVEIQLRSRLQHAWATAVETVGTFTRQALKSSWGDDQWLRFFALMGTAHALREGTPPVPDTPSNPTELKRELRRYARKLRVIDRLNAYGQALQVTEQLAEVRGRSFITMALTVRSQRMQSLSVTSYDDSVLATENYDILERQLAGRADSDVVLVAVNDLDSLRRAYPNYFLDTTEFVQSVREAIE